MTLVVTSRRKTVPIPFLYKYDSKRDFSFLNLKRPTTLSWEFDTILDTHFKRTRSTRLLRTLVTVSLDYLLHTKKKGKHSTLGVIMGCRYTYSHESNLPVNKSKQIRISEFKVWEEFFRVRSHRKV